VHILKGQISNKLPNDTSQTPKKTRTSKTQIKQKERNNNNNKAKLNEIETKKYYTKNQ
jgi:hypothetical protein